MLCTACGSENRPGSRFCDHCGAGLEKTCHACGQPNRADARFCASCGQALAADAAAASAGAGAGGPVPSTAVSAAERRLVSVLFTDLVGFTTLAEDRDPETVRELLSHYFARATDIIALHGGTVEKFIGDAVMAVWGTPVAHEDDAERAVRAAIEMVDAVRSLHPSLQARAGVLTGEAAVTIGATNQGMVAGDLVNTAARLQGAAEPGTVLVGEATMHVASGAIVFEPIGEHSLKGKTVPVPAWRALRVVAQLGGQGRADTLEAPFVGRDEELRELKDTLAAVGRERRIRLVSITGPGGIGKSRLAWELQKYIDGIAEFVWWHSGRSPSYGEGITFWALGEMVRRRAGLTEEDDEARTRERIAATLEEHVPDLAERESIGPALLTLLGLEPAPAGGRDVLFPAWRTFFERIAETGTTVLVFEDLQWADSGLLDFIDHLLDWSRGLPIMVVTLARPELFERRPDFGTGRRHLTALSLEPLTDGAMHELLNGLVPGLPATAMDAIVARADGFPLYAVETVRALLADGRIERVGDTYRPVGDLGNLRVPDSLRSLIASRLDALVPDDRRLLQDAAVLGQVFTADALAAVSGVSGDDMEARLRGLVRRELLDIERDPRSPERGMYKFVQSLIREVAYSTLGRRDRRARHLAVARHFESIGDEELAGALAGHYLSAHANSDEGAESEAIAGQARLALVGAADRAAALGAHDQAVAYLEQALTVASDPRDRAPLLDRAAASAASAANDSAVEYARAAVEAHRAIGDRVAAARAAARLGTTLVDAGDMTGAIRVLEAADDEAADLRDPAVTTDIQARLARAYFRIGRARDAIVAAERALDVAEPLGLMEVVAEAFSNKAGGLVQLGRSREAAALAGAAVELAQRLGLRAFEIRARNNLAACLGDDEPVRASEMGIEAMELAERIGDRAMYNFLLANMAYELLAHGRSWDMALERIREALDATSSASDRGRMLTHAALLEIARGERLGQHARELRDVFGDTDDPDAQSMIASVVADTGLVTGDHATAYEQGMRAAQLQPQDPQPTLVRVVRAGIWAGRPDWVNAAADRLDAMPVARVSAAHQRYATAARLALEGRRDESIAAFRDAVHRLRELGLGFTAAASAVDAAVLFPDAPEIRALADEARLLLEELRARPYLAKLDAALASATSAAPRARDAAPAAVREPAAG